MERLTEREPYWLGEEFWTSAKEPSEAEIDAVYEKLKEYEDLEEQGKLLRLPCKVGDTLYHILACTTAEDFGKKYVSWFIVTHITINTTKEVAIVGRDVCNREWRINSRGIGKTVFLTKAEAEAKLKELEGKEND